MECIVGTTTRANLSSIFHNDLSEKKKKKNYTSVQ